MSLLPSCDPYNELSSARNYFSNLHLFLFQPNFSEWPTLLLTVNRRPFRARMEFWRSTGHGFGLALYDPVLHNWTTRVEEWLRGLGLLGTN